MTGIILIIIIITNMDYGGVFGGRPMRPCNASFGCADSANSRPGKLTVFVCHQGRCLRPHRVQGVGARSLRTIPREQFVGGVIIRSTNLIA